MEMNWYCLKLPDKWWWQNNFDVIMVLIIWHQDYRKEKKKRKMDLEIVTDGKNDKTEKN